MRAEPAACTPEARDHLVDMKQDVVFPADALDLGPVAVGREHEAARAVDRLGRERRHLVGPELEDLLLQLARNRNPVGVRILVTPEAIPIDRWYLHEAGQGQVELRMHRGEPRKRSRRHRDAVIGILARDMDLLVLLALQVPVVANELQCGVVRLRAGICIDDPVKPLRQDRGQLRRKLRRIGVRRLEEGVVVGQLSHRLRRRVGKFRPAIADIHAPQPRHSVDQPVSF